MSPVVRLPTLPAPRRPLLGGGPFRVRRLLLALAVAAMGAIDVLSALLSRLPERLVALRRMVPTEVLDTSRTFTLLAGALLLVTAWGLRRGKRRAFVAAMLLCAVSVPVNLLKAIDFEEATVAAALLFFLGISAEAFTVKSGEISFVRLRSRATWAFVALLVYALVGSWVIKSLYGYQPSVTRAFGDAAYNLFGVGQSPVDLPARLPPGERRVIRWYLHSLPVLSLTFVLGFAITALRPATYRRRHRAAAEMVSGLLRGHGVSSVSAFALAEDTDYFFSANQRAVIAYRFSSDTLLAIGDPIGPAEEIPLLLHDFQRFCRDRDWEFAFFQARAELLPLYRELGWRAIHIGEDPILWTERFTLEGSAMSDARRAVRKAAKAGLEVHHFVPGERPFDLAGEGGKWIDGLRAISNEWLRRHPGGEKDFCMGRFDPEHLRDSWLAIAWNPGARRVEGFLTWEPIWARGGWTLDLMRRRDDAVLGTMELLVARSVEAARARGDSMMSLSLSALAQVTEADGSAQPLPPESNRAREFLMEQLAHYYDFKGLFRWKKKFDPVFEDRYLVFPSPFALPRVTLALARAQSPSGLLSYFRGRGPAASAEPDAAAEDAYAEAPREAPTVSAGT